jgi:drug efflux transport system ATP-binding protein
MAEIAIEARNLSRQFADIKAVSDLNLTIYQGEMFSLVGPDGAGKSTTLRMLCGLVKPTTGSARILGFDLVQDKLKIKPLVGYFSQRFSLYGDLSVDENLQFFAEIHNVPNFHQRREELLQFTRLTEFRHRMAEQLSGGMKQKLALACTLIHTPKIILLDEPTTGVDPVSRRDFWIILSSLLKQGITIVITTPYLDEAERSTRVGLINQGQLMTADTPQKVKGLMKEAVFEIVCSDFRRARDLLQQVQEVKEVQLFGDRLNVVVTSAEASRLPIQKRLAQAGITISDWRVIPPSLENVFISLLRAG